MNDNQMVVLVMFMFLLLIILCLGEPDILDGLIKIINKGE